jgi:small subunit ribosomal protein S21
LTQVTVGENEGIESALRRFKRQVSKSGIFADLKRLRHHETPIEKYKRKLQQRRNARRRSSARSHKFFVCDLIL